ncbi:MAG: hypothetical protein HC808_14140 [Candidatus Competibacteraceae bacterium]|nr:hypothetical protein [Candidatus Competibacteraceae bacterium]
MAKLHWPHQEAQRVFNQAGKQKNTVVFETGYGPSGLPHIGTFAEVARTTFVINAFRNAFPDHQTRLIVFSDDMDGLRNLPENVPNHELLKPHLGAPLSAIPDPFGKEATFSGYMNRQLQHFLDHYGFDYEFFSSTETYRSGRFDTGLCRIMDCYEAIRDLFTASISAEKRSAWSPFFPICESCGKIYTTRVTGIDKDNYTISYCCDQNEGGKYHSCGHAATMPITGGHVKVGWKVDWALRWYMLGVDYEMYGKDLIDSYTMSRKSAHCWAGPHRSTINTNCFWTKTVRKYPKKSVTAFPWNNGKPIRRWALCCIFCWLTQTRRDRWACRFCRKSSTIISKLYGPKIVRISTAASGSLIDSNIITMPKAWKTPKSVSAYWSMWPRTWAYTKAMCSMNTLPATIPA